VALRRGKKRTIPDPSRWDKLPGEDLYVVLETSLSSATNYVDLYRVGTQEEKEALLEHLEMDCLSALEVCRALRRRLVVSSQME
jgi:hypothetical protein